ncbi:hypothetical protein GCM10025734_80790 [Kitasatospora paranensis]
MRELPAGLPGALALAQQPQPHDVAQIPDGVVDAEFVGEVRGPGGVAEDGPVEFQADQGPGAARDVREVGGGGRDGDDGGRGVVRGDGGDGSASRQAGVGGDGRPQQPGPVPGPPQGRQEPRIEAERADQRLRPDAGAGVEEPGGGGVRRLGADAAGEPVGQQIGDEQQGAGRVEDGVPRAAASW